MSHSPGKRNGSSRFQLLFQGTKPDVIAVRLMGQIRCADASPFQQKEFVRLLKMSEAMAVTYFLSLRRLPEYEEHLRKNVYKEA